MTDPRLTPETITLYGTGWCPDCKQSKQFFGEQRIQYHYVDIDEDTEALLFVEKTNNGSRRIPTIVFPGGQVEVTQTLDNFPGFDEGIPGAEFAARLTRQAQRFGAEILQAQNVVSIEQDGQYLCVHTGDGSEYGATAVLLATGARYRRPGIPVEDDLIGVNVHFCATCDGAFYKGKKVLVVGGGNSGFEEGLFLTRFASQVDIVEFLPQVKASKTLRDKVAEMQNMSVTVNHAIKELRAKNGKLDAVLIEDQATG